MPFNETWIESALKEALSPCDLVVINDSAHHQGHAGSPNTEQSHFTVRVVSEKFNGMTRVQRHQWVYDLLKQAFDQGLHALSMTLLTPKEFAQKSINKKSGDF